jgi:hypothetical protein
MKLMNSKNIVIAFDAVVVSVGVVVVDTVAVIIIIVVVTMCCNCCNIVKFIDLVNPYKLLPKMRFCDIE